MDSKTSSNKTYNDYKPKITIMQIIIIFAVVGILAGIIIFIVKATAPKCAIGKTWDDKYKQCATTCEDGSYIVKYKGQLRCSHCPDYTQPWTPTAGCVCSQGQRPCPTDGSKNCFNTSTDYCDISTNGICTKAQACGINEQAHTCTSCCNSKNNMYCLDSSCTTCEGGHVCLDRNGSLNICCSGNDRCVNSGGGSTVCCSSGDIHQDTHGDQICCEEKHWAADQPNDDGSTGMCCTGEYHKITDAGKDYCALDCGTGRSCRHNCTKVHTLRKCDKAADCSGYFNGGGGLASASCQENGADGRVCTYFACIDNSCTDMPNCIEATTITTNPTVVDKSENSLIVCHTEEGEKDTEVLQLCGSNNTEQSTITYDLKVNQHLDPTGKKDYTQALSHSCIQYGNSITPKDVSGHVAGIPSTITYEETSGNQGKCTISIACPDIVGYSTMLDKEYKPGQKCGSYIPEWESTNIDVGDIENMFKPPCNTDESTKSWYSEEKNAIVKMCTETGKNQSYDTGDTGGTCGAPCGSVCNNTICDEHIPCDSINYTIKSDAGVETSVNGEFCNSEKYMSWGGGPGGGPGPLAPDTSDVYFNNHVGTDCVKIKPGEGHNKYPFWTCDDENPAFKGWPALKTNVKWSVNGKSQSNNSIVYNWGPCPALGGGHPIQQPTVESKKTFDAAGNRYCFPKINKYCINGCSQGTPTGTWPEDKSYNYNACMQGWNCKDNRNWMFNQKGINMRKGNCSDGADDLDNYIRPPWADNPGHQWLGDASNVKGDSRANKLVDQKNLGTCDDMEFAENWANNTGQVDKNETGPYFGFCKASPGGPQDPDWAINYPCPRILKNLDGTKGYATYYTGYNYTVPSQEQGGSSGAICSPWPNDECQGRCGGYGNGQLRWRVDQVNRTCDNSVTEDPDPWKLGMSRGGGGPRYYPISSNITIDPGASYPKGSTANWWSGEPYPAK